MEVGGLFAVPTWHLFIRRNPGFILFIMPLWGPSINKPAKSGDLFYSEPIAVIYLFESLFPRLIRTQVYSRI